MMREKIARRITTRTPTGSARKTTLSPRCVVDNIRLAFRSKLQQAGARSVSGGNNLSFWNARRSIQARQVGSKVFSEVDATMNVRDVMAVNLVSSLLRHCSSSPDISSAGKI